MSYLLDTDICIYILNGGNTQLEDKFHKNRAASYFVSTLTEAELHYGAQHSARAQHNLSRVREFLSPLRLLPFDSEAAAAFAKIKQALFSSGTPIGVVDTFLAAVALSRHLVVISNNLRHFKKVPGLKVENWAE